MTDKNVLTLKGTNERIDAIEKQIEEREISLHKDLDILRKEGEEGRIEGAFFYQCFLFCAWPYL